MSKRLLGELLRLAVVILWAVVVYLWVQYALWYLFVIMTGVHLLEAVTIGLKRGKAAGFSAADSFLYTFIFGFTWWKFLDFAPKTSAGA